VPEWQDPAGNQLDQTCLDGGLGDPHKEPGALSWSTPPPAAQAQLLFSALAYLCLTIVFLLELTALFNV
jgi:hypothetical protein